MKMTLIRSISSIFYFMVFLTSKAQVTPFINSNNPNFPFPQFKNYAGGPSCLADKNPVGVPHAEMELRIREAYQILCNDLAYTGTVVAGVQYIGPNAPQQCTCVEQDGYYLLAAAYMGDKKTFDGFYMWSHDRGFNGVKRFKDGVVNSPTYLYSKPLSGAGGFGASTNENGGAAGGNSAGDGDVDVALALLVAYQQWGASSGIIPPATGVEINYKNEAIAYIRGLADTVRNNTIVPAEFGSGDIGMDGYMKGGDTWEELTAWATPGYLGLIPEYNGSRKQHIDYYAPAYFRSFADFFQAEGISPWCQSQFRRAEASSDWLMGQMRAQNLIAHAGWVDMATGTPVFSSFDLGEDFRTAWRTILNYTWNGNPATTWNPTTHQAIAGGNTFERDMGIYHAAFMKDPQARGNASISLAGYPITFCGPVTIQQQYAPDGTGGNGFRLNWMHGVGAPAAIAAQDFDLMAQMYRQCEITWDANTDATQQYLTSKPRYFHEWFRLMGMMILTGNYHDPLDMVPMANMKVYKAVDKTYAFAGDTLTYVISFRNYGKPTATSVTVTDLLDPGYNFLSSSKPVSVSGQSLSWNIGTVTGMNSGNVNLTRDSIILKVIVNASAAGRICNQATVVCSNGTGWTSNEYPNKVEELMERNCVDILTQKPLSIVKTASKSIVGVGDTLAYTIVVKNKPVDFLNGGRQNVNILFGHQGLSAANSEVKLNFRILHGADEAYINYKNYRVSYFLRENPIPAWALATSINEGFSSQLPVLTQQTLTPGADYNHRFIITFPNQIATVTPYILNYGAGGINYIHRGAMETARMEVRVYNPSFANADWTDDWSSDPTLTVTSGAAYHPVGNNWTDPLSPNLPVTKVHRDACGMVAKTTDKVLVEEWDGYTWRRIYGNAPVSGREINSIKVTDTLPAAVTFAGWFPGYINGTVAGNVISWPTVTQLKTNDSIVYKFWVTVKDAAYFNCPAGPAPGTFTNKAVARADKEPVSISTVTTTVSCSPPPPPVTSLVKTANSATYAVGAPITYTLTYTNTDGSTYHKPSSMLATDWTNRVNSMTVSSTALTTIANSSELIVNKYAHGVNGTLSFTVDPHQYATFGIALRNSGSGATMANSLYITFKYQNNTVDITLWNGTTSVSTVSVAGTWTPPMGATQTFDHKLEITGTSLKVYMVDMVTPVTIFNSLPIITAGYAGVINATPTGGDAHGTHIITNWNSHFDSAFDLQITDPIPTGITFGSAISAAYNSSTYSGSNVAGTVTWQKIPGPVLANAVIEYIWTGTVSSCPTGSVLNIGYADVYGISPDPQAQVSISCNSPTPVGWLDFEAERKDQDVRLQWTVAQEINNDYFQPERSSDGIMYSPLSRLVGAGTSMQHKTYFYTDEKVPSGILYYRIKQVDADGQFSFSEVRKVSEESVFAAIVFPVPAGETLGFIFKGAEGNILVKIFNAVGQEVGNYKLEESSTAEVPFGYANGTYLLRISNGEKSVQMMITK